MKSFRPYFIGFVIAVLLTLGAIRAMSWVRDHPEHIPGAQFELAHPQGWATHRKLMAMVDDGDGCFGALDRAGVDYDRAPAVGQRECRADQRMILTGNKFAPSLSPARAAPGCAVTAAMILWDRDIVQPLAQKYFGQKVVRLDNLGSYNCRTIGGGQRQSEHSTANAIDISGFVLADGSRVSVLEHWNDAGAKEAFLHAVRDGSCKLFSTTLSPDYNRAHADHLHLDMAVRASGWTMCR